MYNEIVRKSDIDMRKDVLKQQVKNFIGHTGSFYDDVWVYRNCKGYKESAHHRYTINFSSLPIQFNEITKYFTLSYYGAPSTYNHNIYWLSCLIRCN